MAMKKKRGRPPGSAFVQVHVLLDPERVAKVRRLLPDVPLSAILRRGMDCLIKELEGEKPKRER